jgi:hypothetical protein
MTLFSAQPPFTAFSVFPLSRQFAAQEAAAARQRGCSSPTTQLTFQPNALFSSLLPSLSYFWRPLNEASLQS